MKLGRRAKPSFWNQETPSWFGFTEEKKSQASPASPSPNESPVPCDIVAFSRTGSGKYRQFTSIYQQWQKMTNSAENLQTVPAMKKQSLKINIAACNALCFRSFENRKQLIPLLHRSRLVIQMECRIGQTEFAHENLKTNMIENPWKSMILWCKMNAHSPTVRRKIWSL
jgi:hypothetical protein